LASHPTAATVVELLEARRDDNSGYVAVGLDGDTRTMSFGELCTASLSGAQALQRKDRLRHGAVRTPAVITVSDPLAFIVAFFAVMQAGMVAIAAPDSPEEHPAHRRRLLGMIGDAAPAVVVVDGARLDAVSRLLDRPAPQRPRAEPPDLVAIEHLVRPVAPARTPVPSPMSPPGPEDVAYTQYTSGSTADPKPAHLLHRNVVAELRLLARVYDESADSVAVHWVPLYHGMGLVCAMLRPLFSGYTSVLLDPRAFVARPLIWLEQLSHWRATHTSSPTFGYQACVRAGNAEGLDLSRLRVARVSSELVPPQTLRDFASQFVSSGFQYTAFCPSYGMVESTLAVTSCPVAQDPRVITVSRAALRAGRVTEPGGAADTVRLTSAGPPLEGVRLSILDTCGSPVGDTGAVGEVWIGGPQVVPRPGDEIKGVAGRRTGDLGFLSDGQLVPTGRNTERFKIRGMSYYSFELEAAVSTVDDRLEPGRIAAFVSDRRDEPHLVVVAEVKAVAMEESERSAVCASIVRTVSREFALTVSRVVLMPLGSLPVTTSGKVRREECRSRYESGTLDALHPV